MHETIFLGWGFLGALAANIGLSAYKKVEYPKLMVAFTLSLGGAVVGAYLLGMLINTHASFSSIGAILGGGFTIYLTTYYFKPEPKNEAFNILVSASLLGLLIARTGCLGSQCDFGSPTDFFWGLTYEIGPIWQYHRVLGINEGLLSHAVHPFPWMIIVPGAILFVVVWAKDLRNKAEPLVYGYLLIRFVAEFFRDPSTSVSVIGVQIGIVAMAIAFFVIQRIFSTPKDGFRPKS